MGAPPETSNRPPGPLVVTNENHQGSARRGDETISLQEHWEAIDKLREKFDNERDRRYSEVNIEREKALKIKEEADKAALGLAREIQSYKDEKANQLREQIGSERGSFATKEDLAAAMREIVASMQPLHTYVASMAGQAKQSESSRVNVVALVSIGYGIVATIGVVITLIVLLTRP
jgi:hypothetical protein